MTHRKSEPEERPNPRERRRAEAELPPETTKVYIAGCVHTPTRKKTTAASGVIFENENSRNTGRCLPIKEDQSQYTAEVFATLEAIRGTNKNTTLTVISTQAYVRDAMTKKLSRWEHEGWVGVPNRNVLRCVAAELKARKAPTIFKVVEPGSPDRALCEQAAMLAKRAARTPTAEVWDLTLPEDTNLPGLSLQNNRQKIFYRSIREEKNSKLTTRPSTAKMLDAVREATMEAFERYVSDADIWEAIYTKDLLPRITQFMWKGLHNAHRIGTYWTHIPECKDRAI
jgi:ribonuclease HI